MEARALLYLPIATLQDTLQTVATHEELLADFAATPTLAQLVDGINQSVGATFLPDVFGPGAQDEPNPAPTRLLRDLLTQMSERIDGQPYRSPWESLFAVAIPPPNGGYFLSHDQRLLYVVIDLVDAPRTFDAEHAAIGTIRRAIASLRPEFPSVEAGVTGAPALFSDELDAAAHDGRIASVLALVLTLGLLLLAFRRLVTSSAILLVLALSLGWSLGVVTLIVGHLTIFSMMFASVVIGLGTDYGSIFCSAIEKSGCSPDDRRRARADRGAKRPGDPPRGPHRGRGLLHPEHRRVPRHPRLRVDLRHRDPAGVPVDADRVSALLLLIEKWQKAPRLRLVPGRPGALRLPDVRASGPSQSQVPALARLVRYPGPSSPPPSS